MFASRSLQQVIGDSGSDDDSTISDDTSSDNDENGDDGSVVIGDIGDVSNLKWISSRGRAATAAQQVEFIYYTITSMVGWLTCVYAYAFDNS
jgi:hypothetical protein